MKEFIHMEEDSSSNAEATCCAVSSNIKMISKVQFLHPSITVFLIYLKNVIDRATKLLIVFYSKFDDIPES